MLVPAVTEDTINKFLDSQGFQCEPGSGTIIDEHLPICLYAGPTKLWVAGTAVELAHEYENFRQRAGEIRGRIAEQLKNTDAKGRALIWFSKDVSDEHVGKAIEMLKGVVTRPGWGTIRKNVLVLT